MSDITHIFGGPFVPPSAQAPRILDPPEVQLRDAMADLGLSPPDDIVMDGRIHRFRSGTKGEPGHGDKPGWYIVFPDGVPAGRFGCWRSGVEAKWRAEIGRPFSEAEEMAYVRRTAEAQALRDAERERTRSVSGSNAEDIWAGAQAASPDHPYLRSKRIDTHGARVTGDGRLIVPLLHEDGSLSSLQYIGHDAEKRYHPGAETKGKHWMIGTMDDPGVLYVAEGFATAATVHETTGRPCVVAYSAGNLPPVVESLRRKHGQQQQIVIVADNDKSGTGQMYADQAAAKYGARVVMPPIVGMDANDYLREGHDLRALLEPPKVEPWLVHADEWCQQPAPIAWLVKRWVQEQSLVMVHGPSGSGKTFVVLDWCMRIASGIDEWRGHRVKPASVVYLAGEGHHGLRARIAAWKYHHGSGASRLWLSRSGCDLNTAEGYTHAANAIRALPEPPALIVVDTLHRFLHGDENSAQDAKTMLDACAGLIKEFGCTALLVHHTGVSEEAQHRARGSSAWRGALDIEISVIPPKPGDAEMQIVQRKSKDAEMAQPLWAMLHQVEIPGWMDEDGEAVTSAVVVEADGPMEKTQVKVDTKINGHRQQFEAAWRQSGGDTVDGLPYITKSALVEYLVQFGGKTPGSADQYVKPSAGKGRMIFELITAEMVAPHDKGWLLLEPHGTAAVLAYGGNKW